MIDIVRGNHRFGTWADHVESWAPWTRPNTLFLKYEDIETDLPSALQKIESFLSISLLSEEVPPREKIALSDGKWVRKKSDWRDELSGECLDIFQQVNGDMMSRLDYQ